MEKESLYKSLPQGPGVYLMKGKRGKILYIGKAGNLRKRVGSYFTKFHADKAANLVSEVRDIGFFETQTAIEALILESDLIKKHQPPYNFKEKDDKSFLYVEVTKDKYPRVLLVRGKDKAGGLRFGPFTNASDIRAALRIIRRIFPYNTHESEKIGRARRPCFNAQINLCPGTCVEEIPKGEYMKNIRNIKLFLRGKKVRLVKAIEKDMQEASDGLDFEEAHRLKGQLFALQHIQDIALISKDEVVAPGESGDIRIEGYDISNISGNDPVGSMVVFTNNKPDKREYKKFRIKTIDKSDDVGMMREMMERRFKNDWKLPDLVLVDGGKGQVNMAREVVAEAGFRIPVVGIAKGPKRDKNEFVGRVPRGFDKEVLVRVRDEAHRFAIQYHKKVRAKRFINNG